MDTCANCGGPIRKLEPPYSWDARTVCAGCYAKLKQAADLAATTIPYATPVQHRVSRWWFAVGIGLTVVAFVLTFGLFLTSVRLTPNSPVPASVPSPTASAPISATQPTSEPVEVGVANKPQ